MTLQREWKCSHCRVMSRSICGNYVGVAAVGWWMRRRFVSEVNRWWTTSPTTWRRSSRDECCLRCSRATCVTCCQTAPRLILIAGEASWLMSNTPSCPAYVYTNTAALIVIIHKFYASCCCYFLCISNLTFVLEDTVISHNTVWQTIPNIIVLDASIVSDCICKMEIMHYTLQILHRRLLGNYRSGGSRNSKKGMRNRGSPSGVPGRRPGEGLGGEASSPTEATDIMLHSQLTTGENFNTKTYTTRQKQDKLSARK